MESQDLQITADKLEGLPGGPFTQPVIAQAVAAIRAYCGWHISPRQEKKITVTGYSSVIHLPSMHAEVVKIEALDFAGNPRIVERYMAFPDGRIHLQHAVGPYVRVTYLSGWDEFPADLYGIVAHLAGIVRQGGKITSEALSGHSVSFDTRASGVVVDPILDRYKIPGGIAHA